MADFLELIDLEPFKKSNNETRASVQRSTELEKLHHIIREGYVNPRSFLRRLSAATGCRLQERWLNKFFTDDLREFPIRLQQHTNKSTEERLKEEATRLTEQLRVSQEQNQIIASIVSENSQKTIFVGIIERIKEESQAELKALAEKAATQAEQRAIDMMITISSDWKPSDWTQQVACIIMFP